MLTGDKLETATCIAKSSRLVSRTQDLYVFAPVATRTEAHQQLNTFRKKQDCALVITGDSLEVKLFVFIKRNELVSTEQKQVIFYSGFLWLAYCVFLNGRKCCFELKVWELFFLNTIGT